MLVYIVDYIPHSALSLDKTALKELELRQHGLIL